MGICRFKQATNITYDAHIQLPCEDVQSLHGEKVKDEEKN